MEIGLLTAAVGGALALLSPCAALLMPAFFASAVGAGPRLLLHGAVFYAGLIVVLVPLGVGAGALGAVFTGHRDALIAGASALLVVLGVAHALGFGFDPARLVPGRGLEARAASATGLLKTLLLGAVSGIAGFCAGPILGAVLTVAAARGSLVEAGVLLAAYGAGMVVPLLLIAALWQRLGDRGRRLLRGRTVRVLGRELHTTSLLTGALIVAVGVVFWTTNGLVSAPSLVPYGAQAWLQGRSAALSHPLVDLAAVIAAAAALIVLILRTTRGSRSARDAADSPEPANRSRPDDDAAAGEEPR